MQRVKLPAWLENESVVLRCLGTENGYYQLIGVLDSVLDTARDIKREHGMDDVAVLADCVLILSAILKERMTNDSP